MNKELGVRIKIWSDDYFTQRRRDRRENQNNCFTQRRGERREKQRKYFMQRRREKQRETVQLFHAETQ